MADANEAVYNDSKGKTCDLAILHLVRLWVILIKDEDVSRYLATQKIHVQGTSM